VGGGQRGDQEQGTEDRNWKTQVSKGIDLWGWSKRRGRGTMVSQSRIQI
jgi:hypothetical protein